MKNVAIINTSEIGEIIDTKTVKDQFRNPFDKFIIHVTKIAGDKKAMIKSKKVDYIREVNSYFIKEIK